MLDNDGVGKTLYPGFDIIFLAHGHSETERFLPLMVDLEGRGVRSLLFYQDYDSRDEIAGFHQKIIERYGLEVMDFSSFIKGYFHLKVITLFVRTFKNIIKIRFLYNKFRGLRAKLLKRIITESLIRRVIAGFKPKIFFFDNISLIQPVSYPYGSYYFKKIADELRIKCFSICHGGTVHIPKIHGSNRTKLDFDKIYEPNTYEKEWDAQDCIKDTQILSLGDPRFDIKWKNAIKGLFLSKIEKEIKSMNIEKEIKILYLSPNLEQFGKEQLKYKNLRDVARIAKSLNNATLLIKPHPRYRFERKIRKVMAELGFRDFFILDDSPLICYLGFVDFIISAGTSALHDVLPDGHRKVIIYDNFSDSVSLKNIFRDYFKYFNTYEGLYNFLERGGMVGPADRATDEKVRNFCRKWVGADKELDTMINDIGSDLYREIKAVNDRQTQYREN